MRTLLDGEHGAVQIKWVGGRGSRPMGLEALFELERMVLRSGRRNGADAVDKDAVGGSAPTDGRPEIIVDFSTAERDAIGSARLYLRPLYNGSMGEDAALLAILGGDVPRIEIRDDALPVRRVSEPVGASRDAIVRPRTRRRDGGPAPRKILSVWRHPRRRRRLFRHAVDLPCRSAIRTVAAPCRQSDHGRPQLRAARRQFHDVIDGTRIEPKWKWRIANSE
jgi:hypothetical protein